MAVCYINEILKTVAGTFFKGFCAEFLDLFVNTISYIQQILCLCDEVRGWGKVVCVKLEVESMMELKINSKFLPRTLVAPGLFYNAEGDSGHHMSCVFVELLVMQGT